jgi:hypothetical protein
LLTGNSPSSLGSAAAEAGKSASAATVSAALRTKDAVGVLPEMLGAAAPSWKPPEEEAT